MAEEPIKIETESNESTNTKMCHRHTECAYFTTDRAKVIHKWTFLSVIGTLLLIAVFYFAYSNYVYRSSFRSIIDGHNAYVTNLESIQYATLDSLNVDSITADAKKILSALAAEQKALTKLHKEEASSIDSLLEMHSRRMGDDFANLTLWASVLMIIFLVFSIYAMYKMDEMQNRGSESLSKIYDAYNRVMSEIRNINKIQSDLERNYDTQIIALKERSNTILGKLKEDVGSVSRSVDGCIQSFNTESSKLLSSLDDKIAQKVAGANANLDKKMSLQETIINTLEEQIKGYNSLSATVKALQDTVNKLEAAQVSSRLNTISIPTQAQEQNEGSPKSDIASEDKKVAPDTPEKAEDVDGSNKSASAPLN